MEQLIDELAAPPKLDSPPSRRSFFVGVTTLVIAGIAAVAIALRPPPEPVETQLDAGAPVAQVELDAGPPDAGQAVALVPEVIDAGSAEEHDAGQLAVEHPDAGEKVVVKPQKPVKLTTELVTATLNRESGSVRTCFERHQALLPSSAGSMKVRWTIQLSGEVSAVELMEPSFKGSALDGCITKAVKGFRFPRNTGPPRTLTIPFNYAAKGG